ncbi:PaaI family thioesterase [Pseudoroseicyclus tamaricis]|uniref:PaaI family thioesterase n=1 Tax=Pseudoroseicyclus tamaricis TaxID=2705421 RepID=A0A6B2K678_9RHOB|nr:PaaI family thioesterase [Pseudoroseicyclus tamaricis]NDV02356.1 PaaI family thioesterase [Pseudoroseicyclus tamaricis]
MSETGDSEGQARRERVARAFIEGLPHGRALGLKMRAIGAGTAEIVMPWHENLVGDPSTGVIHGGAVSALMDTTAGAAVMAHPDCPSGTATLDLRIDYMRSATPGQPIVAKATCYHITRTVAFVRAEACDEDADDPVAAATAAFTVERG